MQGGARFNEAAGIPRGRLGMLQGERLMRAASMRPRVFPAEDSDIGKCVSSENCGFNEAAGIPRGRRRRRQSEVESPGASMRPRVFPAEDASSHGCQDDARKASMRPRVFPAEDQLTGRQGQSVYVLQ